MSHEQHSVHTWTCDACGKQEQVENDNDSPAGWYRNPTIIGPDDCLIPSTSDHFHFCSADCVAQGMRDLLRDASFKRNFMELHQHDREQAQ